ncbi:hypothetical protein EVAR_53933_1 [Eumeta japonica]|uniref:PiggyBac transposable element-derived protein 4 n=1 Tax=Eumeta variegata TaxID=151549 RepID=A0A4C1YLA6_EUMVA|nr:hypothetical protein EVAR_53933_1 [Eumeta japonica]
MAKDLNPQQIERLLSDLENEDSGNDEIFPELLSDLSDAEYKVSDHDTDSDDVADSASEKQSCPLHRIESQTDEPLQILEELGYALVIPHVLERRRLSNLSKELKDMMDKFLREVGVDVPEDLPTQGPSQNKKPKKSMCHLCPRSKDSNTPRVCSKCMKNVCRIHSIDVKICTKC